MGDTDIVTWLRSILHNDRSVELRCQEAAEEIECLRTIIEGWYHSSRNAERDIAELTAERDELKLKLGRMRNEIYPRHGDGTDSGGHP